MVEVASREARGKACADDRMTNRNNIVKLRCCLVNEMMCDNGYQDGIEPILCSRGGRVKGQEAVYCTGRQAAYSVEV